MSEDLEGGGDLVYFKLNSVFHQDQLSARTNQFRKAGSYGISPRAPDEVGMENTFSKVFNFIVIFVLLGQNGADNGNEDDSTEDNDGVSDVRDLFT